MFCSQHANCIRYLRTHDGAGRSCQDIKRAMAREEQRTHTFKILVEDIRKVAIKEANRSSVMPGPLNLSRRM
jgi:hypothetical protein